MNMADDIANLLRRFGANADGYLEVEATLDYTEPPIVVPTVAAEPAPVPEVAEAIADVTDSVHEVEEAVSAESAPATMQLAAAATRIPLMTSDRIEPVFSNIVIEQPSAAAEIVEHNIVVEEAVVAAAVPVAATVAAVAAPIVASSVSAPAPVIAPIAAVIPAPVSAPVTGIRSSLRSLLTEIALERQAETQAANEETSPSIGKSVTPAQVIAVVSPKGGVGKSTICAALASALNRNGRAIAIDLDPQNALQYHVGVNQDAATAVNAGLIGEDWSAGLLDGAVNTRVLPYGAGSEKDRRAFERNLEQDGHWLSGKLANMHLNADDVIVLDTPPGRTLYLEQALDAAEQIVVVITPDAGSFMVLDQIDALLEGRADRCSYIVNQFDASRTFCQDMLKVLKRRLGTKLIGVVPLEHAISEGLAFGNLPLLQDDASPARQEVLKMADILKRDDPRPAMAGGRAS